MKISKIIKMPYILITIAAFLIICSFAYVKFMQEPPAEEEIKYVPGDLIIRIRSYVKENFARFMEEGRNVLSSDYVLSELVKHDIVDIKHLYSNFTFKETDITTLSERQRDAIEKREAKMPWQKEYMPKIKDKLSRTLLMKFPPHTDMRLLAKEIEQLPFVEYAAPNYYCYAFGYPQDLPNDTYVDPDGNNEWSVGAWGQDYEDKWGLKRMNMAPEGEDTTWSVSEGENIIVAVIDTGIDYTHRDLQENIWINAGELPPDLDTDGDGVVSFSECIARLDDYNEDGAVNLMDLLFSLHEDGIDDDANGFVDDFFGWDFVNNDNDPNDDNYHGTGCAGIIGAVGDNGIGIIGVGPKVKLMAIKGLGSGRRGSARGTTSGIVQCFEYAGDNGAKVISNSWGEDEESTELYNIIRDRYYMGCVVIAAAGNDNRVDAIRYYPAKMSEVITVANTAQNGYRDELSSYGNVIDVIAPGANTLTTAYASYSYIPPPPGSPAEDTGDLGDEYLLMGGTSAACPHVSGLAALILSHNSSFTNEQVNQIIRTSAVDVTDPLGDGADYPGFDIHTGYGLINAIAALEMENALECRIAEPRMQTVISSPGEIEIKGVVSGPNFSSYSIEYKREGEDMWDILLIDDEYASHPYRLDMDGNPVFDTLGTFIDPPNGDYIIKLTAMDTYGNVFEDRIALRVDIVNAPPILNPIGDKETNEDELLEFTVTAADAGAELIFGMIGLPWDVFDEDMRIFSWTPSYEQAGSYVVTFTVSDGELIDSETITITVHNVNRSPVLGHIGNKEVNENELLEFGVNANDPDGGAELRYGIIGLPRNAIFDEDTREFTWRPSYEQAGTYDVTFTVSDGELTDSETITITVNNINRPPVLGPISNCTVYEGRRLQLKIKAKDPDRGDILSFSATNLPRGARFDARTRIFSWTPAIGQGGRDYVVTFIVTDNGTPPMQDSENVRIRVLRRAIFPPR